MNEAYISVDIEAAGPIPGEYSMLSIGACLVDVPTETFYIELVPITDRFVPEALQVSQLSMEQLVSSGCKPIDAMMDFADWVASAAGRRDATFVGFNASFDWSFVNWYFHNFVGKNPFGIGGIDIKSYYMGLTGCAWNETTSSKLPSVFQPRQGQTHHALDDARAQAEIFASLLAVERQWQV